MFSRTIPVDYFGRVVFFDRDESRVVARAGDAIAGP